MRRASLALVVLALGCSRPATMALDHAVMAYDRTTVDVDSKLLLLNIARAHRDHPLHFTSVSSIAATYEFRLSAGVGPALTGEHGWLPTPSVGASASENPTITITPMHGDEFTQRLLTPFDEQKVMTLLRQGYDVDALLRLIGDELRLVEGGVEVVCLNRPNDREGYARFRRAMSQLSTVQDRHALHAGPIPLDDGVAGRVAITNYKLAGLSVAERKALQDELRHAPPSEVLVDVRAGHVGGEVPIHGVLRLRSFLLALSFVGRGISAEREYDVPPDPRTPKMTENPAHTLEIVEATDDVKDAELTVVHAGKVYALAPERGYPWNKKVFGLLYQLFQMTVAPNNTPAPIISIAK